MDCPNCSESFRFRAEYAAHLGECLPRMIVDASRGYLVTEIPGVPPQHREGQRDVTKAHTRREKAPLGR